MRYPRRRTDGAPFFIGRPKRAGPFTLGARGAKRPRATPIGPEDAGVYVLELREGRFYVGKSTAIAARLRQHAEGTGATCARGFVRRVAPVTPRIDDLEAWERAETLTRMHAHGISKVRGWMYTAPSLGPALRDHAFQQVCEKLDLCRREQQRIS